MPLAGSLRDLSMSTDAIPSDALAHAGRLTGLTRLVLTANALEHASDDPAGAVRPRWGMREVGGYAAPSLQLAARPRGAQLLGPLQLQEACVRDGRRGVLGRRGGVGDLGGGHKRGHLARTTRLGLSAYALEHS
jgi:hypothetical protein